MREAFEKWVSDKSADEWDWSQVHGLSRRAAHFWLSVFLREVEKRAGDSSADVSWLVFLALISEFGLEDSNE